MHGQNADVAVRKFRIDELMIAEPHGIPCLDVASKKTVNCRFKPRAGTVLLDEVKCLLVIPVKLACQSFHLGALLIQIEHFFKKS